MAETAGRREKPCKPAGKAPREEARTLCPTEQLPPLAEGGADDEAPSLWSTPFEKSLVTHSGVCLGFFSVKYFKHSDSWFILSFSENPLKWV